MRITEADLRKQYDRIMPTGDWIRDAEDAHGVPPFLLFALGSRETNLRNIDSRDGHGHGMWQRDDRSFSIPIDYLDMPDTQARDAAMLLMSHRLYFTAVYPQHPVWLSTICAYNGGRNGVRRKLDDGLSANMATTNLDYGSDVLERWSYFVRWGWGQL